MGSDDFLAEEKQTDFARIGSQGIGTLDEIQFCPHPLASLQSREDLFVSSDVSGEVMIALRERFLEKIGPMHEKAHESFNSSANRAQSPGTAALGNPLLLSSHSVPAPSNQPGNGAFHGSSSANSVASLANSEMTRRTSKRKLANENSMNTKRRGEIPKLERLVPKSFPPEYPFNKEGYRFACKTDSSICEIIWEFVGITWRNPIHILPFDKSSMRRKSGPVSSKAVSFPIDLSVSLA